jgi:DNA replication and repair protein RecF
VEVTELELVDFRNYLRAEVEFGHGLNLIIGKNAQGKTNLLEAIYVLSALESHRTSPSSALVRHGAERAVVRAKGRVRGRTTEMDVEVRSGGGVRARVNKVPLSRGGSGVVAVLFSPEDLALAKGGPEERRRFLDHMSARLRPLAAVNRQEFERALKQRNAALKAAQSKPGALSSLHVWDEQFISRAASVARNRLEVLEQLRPGIGRHYRELSGRAETPELHYRASWGEVSSELEESGIAALLSKALDRARLRELERGLTLVGPHRDDLEIKLADADVRIFGSQGEHRTLALCLRLAERDLLAEAKGEEPVLLLDDVFSELDDERRSQLASLVWRGQTIATATSLSGLPGPAGRLLRVESGKVLADE